MESVQEVKLGPLEFTKEGMEDVKNLTDFLNYQEAISGIEEEPIWLKPLIEATGREPVDIVFEGLIDCNTCYEHEEVTTIYDETEETGVGYSGASTIHITNYKGKVIYIVNEGGDYESVFS